jgi:hypothetical protein
MPEPCQAFHPEPSPTTDCAWNPLWAKRIYRIPGQISDMGGIARVRQVRLHGIPGPAHPDENLTQGYCNRCH